LKDRVGDPDLPDVPADGAVEPLPPGRDVAEGGVVAATGRGRGSQLPTSVNAERSAAGSRCTGAAAPAKRRAGPALDQTAAHMTPKSAAQPSTPPAMSSRARVADALARGVDAPEALGLRRGPGPSRTRMRACQNGRARLAHVSLAAIRLETCCCLTFKRVLSGCVCSFGHSTGFRHDNVVISSTFAESNRWSEAIEPIGGPSPRNTPPRQAKPSLPMASERLRDGSVAVRDGQWGRRVDDVRLDRTRLADGAHVRDQP